MKTCTIDGVTYEYHSWQDLGEALFHLSKKVMESGKSFDRLIALAKGGLTFSRSLVDYLDIKELSSFQIEFYTGINSTAKTPVITQNLAISVRNEQVLLFDDVVDQGETMKMAVAYLKQQGAKEITTTSIISKPWSKFTPDFSAHVTDAWVIFPNESRETIRLLTKQWQQKGIQAPEIVDKLLQIGFPKEEVEFFTQIP